MKIKAKIDRLVNGGSIKAIASITLDGLYVVKNLRVVDGAKGLFVACPQETYTGKDGSRKYSNVFFPITNMAKEDLQDAVLQAYAQYLNQQPEQAPYAQIDDPYDGMLPFEM